MVCSGQTAPEKQLFLPGCWFDKPDEGDVFLNDLNITKLPMYKRAKMGIGYLPQEASVFRKLSVEDNIAAVLEMSKLQQKRTERKTGNIAR